MCLSFIDIIQIPRIGIRKPIHQYDRTEHCVHAESIPAHIWSFCLVFRKRIHRKKKKKNCRIATKSIAGTGSGRRKQRIKYEIYFLLNSIFSDYTSGHITVRSRQAPLFGDTYIVWSVRGSKPRPANLFSRLKVQ